MSDKTNGGSSSTNNLGSNQDRIRQPRICARPMFQDRFGNLHSTRKAVVEANRG